MKRNIFYALLFVNAFLIFSFVNVKFSLAYTVFKIDILNTANPLTDLDKKRFFKKEIKEQKVLIKEIKPEEILNLSALDFLNESKENYILHSFDGEITKNFIFFNPDDETFPHKLLDLLSLLVIHGNLDNNNSFETNSEIIKTRPIVVTCGSASIFIKNLLNEVNAKSRLVLTMTLDEWNSYDNGHTLLEVHSESLKKWFLYDIDGQNVFIKDGELLSLLEVQNNSLEEIQITPISNQAFSDYTSFQKYHLLSEYIDLNPKRWYKRVFQKFSIYDELTSKYTFLVNSLNKKEGNSDCEKLNEYFSGNINCLTEDDFKLMFY